MSRSNQVKRRYTDNGNSFDVFDCRECGKEFVRPTMRGVKPFECVECGGIVRSTPARVAKPEPLAVAAVSAPIPAKPRHYRFALVKAILAAGVNVFLVGPAGSGKSTLGRHIADDLGIPFYSESGHELMTAYDLLGFRNANGDFVTTNLARAVEYGGLFLMDEMDAMNAAALVAVNYIAALAPGDRVTIGDREVIVHDDFRLMGGGNTWGRGANGAYVTRQILDAATLDRFACVEFGYDQTLEYLASGVPVPAHIPAQPRYKRGGTVTDADITGYVSDVQRYRQAFESAAIEGAMVTPRASINGAKMLRAGIHRDYVEASLIRKGLSNDEWRTVKAHMPAPVSV